MMRQAQSALRLLLRLQAARQKTEANSAANERAAWTEHCAIGLMAQALPLRPEKAAISEPSTPEPLAEPEPAEQPEPEPVAAEACASAYPRNAALLRRWQFLPDTIVCFPPDDELYQRPNPVSLDPSPRPWSASQLPVREGGVELASPPPLAGGVRGGVAASRPPDGTRLDRRFAEAPTCLAYSETRQR